MDRRVVITGMGVVCPLGNTVNELWKNLVEGKTSIRDVTDTCPWLEEQDYRTKVGSLFHDFELDAGKFRTSLKGLKRMDLFSQFALEAARQAISDSGIDCDSEEIQERTGVVIGTGIGGLGEIERQKEVSLKKGLKRISPNLIPAIILDAASGNIAIEYGFHATECPVLVSACASGASSIASAYDRILLGRADIIIAGGTEESGSSLTFGGFGNAKALSRGEFGPEKASSPFDINRSGFVLGEGAGIIVLEELECAKARRANIYAELLGYGATTDACSLTMPNLEGTYSSKAMIDAMMEARINPDQISYINTHGTSTPLNDPIENLAIKKALGDHAYKISLNSTKSMIGHPLGAAGGIEAVVTIKTMQEGLVHPTRNLEKPDLRIPLTNPHFKGIAENFELRHYLENPGLICDLDYTPKEARERNVDFALSNSFGFFGHNVVLAFGKYKG